MAVKALARRGMKTLDSLWHCQLRNVQAMSRDVHKLSNVANSNTWNCGFVPYFVGRTE